MAIDKSKLRDGVWYSPTMKIYALTGNEYVAEISTYPRAYRDTTPHVYDRDTEFTVTQDDLNVPYDAATMQRIGPAIAAGKFVYLDGHNYAWLTGEKAKHYAGESLPGAFPVWIESELLPTGVVKSEHEFPLNLDALLGELAAVRVLEIGKSTGVYLDKVKVNEVTRNLSSGKVVVTRELHDDDRQVLYVRYLRALRTKK